MAMESREEHAGQVDQSMALDEKQSSQGDDDDYELEDEEQASQYDDDDYEPPAWGQVGQVGQETSDRHGASDLDELFEAAIQKRREITAERRGKVFAALAKYEPVYNFKNERPVSDVLRRLQQFMLGPQPCESITKCQELSAVIREMNDCIFSIDCESEYLTSFSQQLSDLRKRCRAVRTSVDYHRQIVMSISNSIAYTYEYPRVDYVVDERFELNTSSVLTPSVVSVTRPDHLDDSLIETAKTNFKNFVYAIGRTLNGNQNRWKMKATEVDIMQTFMRENLAVDRESFRFLDEESYPDEQTRRLTNHQIWWGKNDVENFEKISWAKLLKSSSTGYDGNLGVISKDRRMFKKMLNELVELELLADDARTQCGAFLWTQKD